MTTKEQERKALEQIKKIVAGLGEDSYLATAFDGCFDLAERNIDEDAAYSMKGRWEYSEKERDAAIATIDELKKRACDAEKMIDDLEAKLAKKIEEVKALKEENYRVRDNAIAAVYDEKKDITIQTTGGDLHCKSFAKVEYFNNDGFQFVNVVEKSGWTTSYKIEDLKVLRIE